MPVVDILMPARDAEAFLDAAVGSILRQSFTEWRLIAVDDASADSTWEILCRLSRADGRILPLKNEGRGVAAALNTALAHSQAPMLARMDSDDLSGPTRLEALLGFLEKHPDAGVAGSRVDAFPPEAVSPNQRRYLDWQNSLLTPDRIRAERYVESTLTHATAVFRREVLEGAGGWREGPFPEDLDLWLRLHRAGVVFVKHPDVLYRWREHPARETRTSDRCSPEAFHRCKASHLAHELRDRGAADLLLLAPGRTGRRWERSLSDAGFTVRVMDWKPGLPLPGVADTGDFILASFGVPAVRERARKALSALGPEEERWLFV